MEMLKSENKNSDAVGDGHDKDDDNDTLDQQTVP